jgi:hypothetical protein
VELIFTPAGTGIGLRPIRDIAVPFSSRCHPEPVRAKDRNVKSYLRFALRSFVAKSAP